MFILFKKNIFKTNCWRFLLNRKYCPSGFFLHFQNPKKWQQKPSSLGYVLTQTLSTKAWLTISSKLSKNTNGKDSETLKFCDNKIRNSNLCNFRVSLFYFNGLRRKNLKCQPISGVDSCDISIMAGVTNFWCLSKILKSLSWKI